LSLPVECPAAIKTKLARTFPKNSGETESELGEVFGLV